MNQKKKIICISCIVLTFILICGLLFLVLKILPEKRALQQQQEQIRQYYEDKYELYRQENESFADYEVDVAFLGDSLTDGYDLEKYYPDATEEELNFIAKEAGYFHSILLRENGILHLNFFGAYDDCFYITFRVTENSSEIIDCGRGFYLEAAVPNIATYPEKAE